MSREKILAEIFIAELKDAGVKPPKAPSQEKEVVDKTKYCRFHKCHGHVTDDCIHLKDTIEMLIQQGRLNQFTKNSEPERQAVELITDGKEKNPAVVMSVEQLNTFSEHMDVTPYMCSWEHFPAANVIIGGTSTLSVGSMKRKLEELLSVNHIVQPGRKSRERPPLALYDHELPGGAPNSAVSLLVQDGMANFDVRRVLIDTGASCDIMYTGMFKTLQLTESNLAPYVGTEIYGFNDSSTKLWGYVELLVTFEKGNGTKTIKIPFLVIDCTSLYNYIIGRTGLAQLGATCSTSHLKLKYHADNNTITTLHGDIEAAQRCFLQTNKIQNSISLPEQSSMDEGKTSVSTLDSNLIELDLRFTKSEQKELKKEKKDPFNVEILCPILDRDFKLIPFGDDPTKCFKLGKGIP